MAAKNRKGSDYNKIAKIAKIATDLLPSIEKAKKLPDKDMIDRLRDDWKRIGVINMDTIFDSLLKNVFILYFVQTDKAVKKLFDPSIGGPLVSLTYKARLAYALGLIGETALNDYEYIHKIRNEFAHSTNTSFADAKVISHVQKLSTARGHKATVKNSFEFYEEATHVCMDGISDALEQTRKQLKARGKAKKSKRR